MPDREKVVKELRDLRRYFEDKEWSPNRADRRSAKVYWQTVTDAIAMLKDHEPVNQKVSEWQEDSDPGQEYGTTWACRKCMHSIHRPYIWNPYDSGYKYCPHCGAMMER